MKRSSIFLPIILALAALVVSPQRGSSATVGYVNVVFLPGYNLINNPLKAANNSVTNVISTGNELTSVFVWDVPTQTFSPPATYDPGLEEWEGNFDLPPGRGFVVLSLSKRTNTFVGEVLQGSLSNLVAGGNNFSLLGSKAPIPGKLSSVLQYSATDGENVYLFNSGNQTYSDAYTFFDPFGWFFPTAPSISTEPVLDVGRGFFVQNPGNNKYWIQQFAPLFAPLQNSLAGSRTAKTSSASIRNVTVGDAKVTLDIANTKDTAYNVQFSSDGVNWKTVATKQHGSVWRGPYLGGSQGYFQLTQP